MDQLYGVWPPLAASVAEYAVFVTPPGSEEVVICTIVAAAVIVILKFADVLPTGELESLTLTVNDEVPVVLGVPLIWPEPLRLKPAGKDPDLTDQVYGAVPPVAPSDVEYALLA